MDLLEPIVQFEAGCGKGTYLDSGGADIFAIFTARMHAGSES